MYLFLMFCLSCVFILSPHPVGKCPPRPWFSIQMTSINVTLTILMSSHISKSLKHLYLKISPASQNQWVSNGNYFLSPPKFFLLCSFPFSKMEPQWARHKAVLLSSLSWIPSVPSRYLLQSPSNSTYIILMSSFPLYFHYLMLHNKLCWGWEA